MYVKAPWPSGAATPGAYVLTINMSMAHAMEKGNAGDPSCRPEKQEMPLQQGRAGEMCENAQPRTFAGGFLQVRRGASMGARPMHKTGSTRPLLVVAIKLW